VSTSLGYLVNSLTGESVPLERCLVIVGSGAGRPIVCDKTNGIHYQTDPAWVFVEGADDSAAGMMNHPSFRLEMKGKAVRSGQDLAVLANLGKWNTLLETIEKMSRTGGTNGRD